MYLYDRNMVANTNLKYASSSSNYYVIMMVQNMKKLKIRNSQLFSHSRGTKCRFEANNNRDAFVVCARHVVKRPSKRSALVLNTIILNTIILSLVITYNCKGSAEELRWELRIECGGHRR